MLLWYSGDAAKIRYAVLAVVSNCCPPLKGRLLTCYSPVRHCSRGASSPFTVRLACVRRAASVRPEPGSNSLKFVLNRPSGRFNLLYINASVNFSTLLFAYPEFSFLIFRALPSASPSPLPLSSKRRIDKVMLIRSFSSVLFNFQGAVSPCQATYKLYHFRNDLSRGFLKKIHKFRHPQSETGYKTLSGGGATQI